MCVYYLRIIFTWWLRIQLALLFNKHRVVGAEDYESRLHRNVFPMLGHELVDVLHKPEQARIN